MIKYPNIDPIIFEVGPLAIRWYSLAYIAGIVLGCYYIDWLNRGKFKLKNLKAFVHLLTCSIIGIIIGGRLGYTLFYNFSYYFNNPLDILKIWQGGMSFHGGIVGFIVANYACSLRNNFKFLQIMDLCACATPIGLFFGRIANFINGELFGRVSDVPWAMVFPYGGDLARHPSQIYEAALEGVFLFIFMFYLARKTNLRKYDGLLSAIFLISYSLIRMFIELFREPDEQLGFILTNITMGQILSLPMLILGIFLIIISLRKYES